MITNMIVLLCLSALFPVLMGTEEVILRRMNGEVNFFRPWKSYKWGFGNKGGEYWLGVEFMHQLTRKEPVSSFGSGREVFGDRAGGTGAHRTDEFCVRSLLPLHNQVCLWRKHGEGAHTDRHIRHQYKLRVDLEDFEGQKAYALYKSFSVDSEADGYKLHVSGFVDGGAGDSLSPHNGMKFSTFDKDQDLLGDNCALKYYQGGFWYKNCYYTNPTGNYLWEKDNRVTNTGATWYYWKKSWNSLKSISMKIRRVK
ncbi:microfibril-associated glycoprotein 4-like [Sinocyclocheilus anshuiensis]|uniref:microfibril-associated glycoprotein 4-like n=1 Tax=Sinocyclocheilus anshuiensis TaxID=1608454 RepID=UPI0007BA18A7|nr:PREDICTED: microfibril-associated glycoprotein 4-like [Sinocyclocheilus anshuiensis]